jgi:hypothetical protein
MTLLTMLTTIFNFWEGNRPTLGRETARGYKIRWTSAMFCSRGIFSRPIRPTGT